MSIVFLSIFPKEGLHLNKYKMKILCIDSTTAVARIAIVENNIKLKEECIWASSEDWDNIERWEVFFLTQRLLDLIEKMFGKSQLNIEDMDLLCYSWFSWYKSSINLGKILCHILSKCYNIEYIAVDHITSHYFSYFTDKKDLHLDFPILFISASWSHHSTALMKNIRELSILNDETYYSEDEKRYYGLGLIYYRAMKICELMTYKDSTNQISEILWKLKNNNNTILVDKFKLQNQNTGIFDINFHTMFFYLQDNYEYLKKEYENQIIFFSFEKAIHEIIEEKIIKIMQMIPLKTICIVWGIAMNENFSKHLSQVFNDLWINIVRPDLEYRLDNASMLWTLAYFMKEYNVQYPFSNHLW